MANCKLEFGFVFYQLLANEEVMAAAQHDVAIVGGSQQEFAEIVRKSLSYVKSPDLLSIENIKKDFPGKYNTSGCEDRFRFCSYVNEDDTKSARLSSFEIPYRSSLRPAGGVLTLTLPGSGECYRLSSLNTMLGMAGKRPKMPTGDMFFGPSESETVILQYKKFNHVYPQFSVTAFVHGECVATLNIDLKIDK